MPHETFRTKKEALKFANRVISRGYTAQVYQSGFTQLWIVDHSSDVKRSSGIFGSGLH